MVVLSPCHAVAVVFALKASLEVKNLSTMQSTHCGVSIDEHQQDSVLQDSRNLAFQTS